MEIQKGAKIGLISRIDYGSKGFRQSAVRESFRILEKEEHTHFNIMAGGLVTQKAIVEQMKAFVKSKGEGLNAKDKAEHKTEFEEMFLRKCAKELAKIIPVILGLDPENNQKEKAIDLFIVPSPAFDGEVGERIALLLSEEREDIRVMNSAGDRFLVKYVNKLIWVLTPVKAVWMRGDYFSTAVERVIKDKIKQTSQGSPDLYVVGCFGSSIHKPQGELKYQYVTVPVCHRLEDTRVAENQVGVAVLEFPPDGGIHRYRVHSLKDMVARELSFVVHPSRVTANQKKIIEIIKSRGWVTPGIVRSELGINVEDTKKEMESLMRKKTFRRNGENWPGIYYQEQSRKYYFDLKHIQTKLRYAPLTGPFQEDRIVSFACLHAGSVETDYNFFVNRVPQIILEQNAQLFVGAGDIIEGNEHDLMIKGEIIAGANNTSQEKWAANMVGMVMMKVFKVRFEQAMKSADKTKLVSENVLELVRASLVAFNVIPGNHDLWSTKHGHTPLEIFRATLEAFLNEKIQEILSGYKLPFVPIASVVGDKITSENVYNLPSGLKLSIQHPHMSRAKTTSIRPQEMMDFGKRIGCQVTIGANFHVGETVNEWDMDLGQCVCQEIGTVKHGSNFERNKMKTVDQGVGYLRVISKDKRIVMTESIFDGANNSVLPINNVDVVNMYLQKIGITLIK